MSATLFIGGLLLTLFIVLGAWASQSIRHPGQIFMIALATSFGCFIMLLSVIQP